MRIATVVSIGLATIAAAIGAGGLGVLIYRGVAIVDHRLILAGAVPAALLALGADGLLGWIERRLAAVRRGWVAAVLILAACRPSAERPLRIGSKNFSEQVILGEIAAQGLEARGMRVDRRLNLGGTFICHQAVKAGELDLYPEYTGTAFTAILSRKPVSDPKLVFDEVSREYRKRWNLVWSPPLGFENTFAIVDAGRRCAATGTAEDLRPRGAPGAPAGFRVRVPRA